VASIKWVWKYIKPYKIRLFTGLILVLICSLLSMVTPYMSGKIVDEVINGKNTGLLLPIILLMAGVTLTRSVLRYTFLMGFEKVSQNSIFSIREEVYKGLQELDFDFFDRTRTGDIMTRMMGDIDTIRHFIAWVIYVSFENATIFLFAVIIMLSVNYKFTLIMLAITPATGYFAYKLSTSVRPTFANIREQFSKLNSVVQENISGNRVVKAFAKEDYEIEKFLNVNEEYRQSNLRSSHIWERYLPVLDSLGGMLSVVMILVGGIMVVRKTLTMGELVTFNSLIFAINNPMRMVGWLVNDTQRFCASAEKVAGILETQPNIKNSGMPVEKERIAGMVEFKNVSFSYGDEPVLKSINFRAMPGQTIAIIGPTGSGKTTVVNLINRFYDCSSGEVLIDGVNIKNMDIRKLRENIAVAMQDIFLFSDTVEGNIAYGVPSAPFEQVQKVASAAAAHEFIVNFQEGYDTIIGERGVGLSGGQKQRIALARALLKNPSILILDDTTSNVDIETEHQIHKTLKSFYKERTTFIIAHRISTVKNADMILVINNGKIVEQGRHEDLLAKKGYYYSVFINQFGNFNSEGSREAV
jgi:ATP-binding cassette subfamily B protein